MSALERPPVGGAIERPSTGPGRGLGQKRKPQLRLALGYRDEDRRGAPVKTDHFLPRGSDAAVAKFQSVYGDKPRSVAIRLPASLGGFLDIRHVAFAGGQNDGGGILKAIGAVNFALEGTLGGPDRLTVFNVVETGEVDRNNKPVPQIQVDEVYIDDVDDLEAKALGVYLQATVTFGIPDVLGFGGICEIRSRGKETIDTLWETAVDIYGALGARASMILRPKLVLKESSMITPRGGKAQVFVVDLYVPESMDEIVGKLRELRELMPGGAAQALYGVAASVALTEGSSVVPLPTDGGVAREADISADSQQADASATGPPRDASAPGFGDTSASGETVAADATEEEEIEWPGEADDPTSEDVAETLALAAALYKPGSSKWPNMSLGEIWQEGVKSRDYFKWCVKNAKKPEFIQALRDFIGFYAPELIQEALAETEVQS